MSILDRDTIKGHGTATIGTTAVQLRAGTPRRASCIIQNSGPGQLYVGTSAVTSSNSPAIAVGGSIVLDQSTDDIWAIASQAATVIVFVEEINL